MGRFGHIENLWAILVEAVLVDGLFSYRPYRSWYVVAGHQHGNVPDATSNSAD